jgi:hypothetical protein
MLAFRDMPVDRRVKYKTFALSFHPQVTEASLLEHQSQRPFCTT